jgi:hypothetical protein
MIQRLHRQTDAGGASFGAAAILALLVPYIVGFTPAPEDSASTSLTVAAGGGSYAHVSRDCSGKVLGVENIPFQDVAVGVERRSGMAAYGARAGMFRVEPGSGDGIVRDRGQRSWYVNPYIGIEGRDAGVQFGAVILRHTGLGEPSPAGREFDETPLPSARIRLGQADGLHLLTGFASNMPLGSGGGVYDLGLGFPIGDRARGWLGLALVPYEEGAVSTKLEIPVLERLTLNPRFQIRTGDAWEYGLALGGTVRF